MVPESLLNQSLEVAFAPHGQNDAETEDDWGDELDSDINNDETANEDAEEDLSECSDAYCTTFKLLCTEFHDMISDKPL